MANLGLEAVHAAAGLEDSAFDVVGHVIDAPHHRVVFVFRVLREGDEEHRTRRLGASGVVVLCVAHDADDFIGAAVGFVDDDDVLGGGGVVFRDRAAADDVLAEGLEIAWGNVIPGRADGLVHAGHAVTLADDHFAPVVGERGVLGGGGALNAGDVGEAILQLAIHGVELGHGV